MFKRVLALALALALMAGLSARADGLGDTVAYYLDLNDDVRFSAAATLKAAVPFGDDAVAMLNAVLKHVTLDAALDFREGAARTELTFAMDGQSVATFSEREENGATTLATSALPNRMLTAEGSAMEALLGDADAEEPAFDALAAIREAQGCYKALTDAIMPYAEEKKANYKIKGIGTGRWSRVARLTPEQSAELLPQMAAVLGCGMDADFRAQLSQMTCQKGFVVALYRDKEGGKDLAVYMKGTVAFADGAARSLSYQWAFTDSGTEREDTYKLEVKKTRAPADNRLVSASYQQKSFTDRFEVAGKSEATLKTPDATVVTTVKHDLAGKATGGARTFAGTMSAAVKTTVDGDATTVTTTYTPDLTLTSAEGSGVLSGTVGYQRLDGKTVLTDLTVALDEKAAQTLATAAGDGSLYAVGDEDVTVTIIDPSQIAAEPVPAPADAEAARYEVGKPPIGYTEYETPAETQQIDIGKASAAQKRALVNELAQNFAGSLLVAMAKLPAEDLALMTDNLSEANIQAFTQLLEGL